MRAGSARPQSLSTSAASTGSTSPLPGCGLRSGSPPTGRRGAAGSGKRTPGGRQAPVHEKALTERELAQGGPPTPAARAAGSSTSTARRRCR